MPQNVSTSAIISSPVSNTATTVTISYTENGITKTAQLTGSYYVAASDALTQTVVSNGTTTINETEFDLVKFGDYPQTIAGSGISYSSSTVYNGWYLGSDGYFYERLISSKLIGNNIANTFTDGTELENGKVYYFKIEPIEWRVLTDSYDHDQDSTTSGKKFLFSEKVLLANVPFYGTFTNRSLNGNTIYANNYKYSNMRAYLNGIKNQFITDGGQEDDYNQDWSRGGFLQEAFTPAAQNLITTTKVSNSAESTTPYGYPNLINSGVNIFACEDTSDKIFNISLYEISCPDYGFREYDSRHRDEEDDTYKNDDINRIRYATDYLMATYGRKDSRDNYGSYYQIRSPNYYYEDSLDTIYGGSLNSPSYDGDINSVSVVYYKYDGICPALCLAN